MTFELDVVRVSLQLGNLWNKTSDRIHYIEMSIRINCAGLMFFFSLVCVRVRYRETKKETRVHACVRTHTRRL